MMKWLLQLSLIGILVLPAPAFARGGNDRPQSWENLLDRYESICLECMDLRNQRDAGQTVSARRLQLLLDELERLREELKGASDKMPASARYRFEAIRRMYASGVVTNTKPPEIQPFLRIKSPMLTGAAPPAPVPQRRESAVIPADSPSEWILSISAVILPEPTFGVMGSWLGKSWGTYAAFRSSFSRHTTSYDALSDGTSGSIRIWTTGNSASDRLFLTVGPVYRLTDRWALFGGLGAGSRKLCWEDSEGLWMRVNDASRTGLCTELGATFLWQRTAVSASWISLPFSYHALALSAGIRF